MILSFELTMPNRGSWNGQWSGSQKRYFIHRKVTPKKGDSILEGKPRTSFYYNFGDGWGASIGVERVDGATKRKQKKNSAGFCGYDWMVQSILLHGKILNSIQEKELLQTA